MTIIIEKIVEQIFNLILQILTSKDAKNRILLEEYVNPLKDEVEALHRLYLEKLTNYRNILRTESPIQLADDIEDDINYIMFNRLKIGNSILSSPHYSSMSNSRKNYLLRNYIKSAENYLLLDQDRLYRAFKRDPYFRKTNLGAALSSINETGILRLYNPTFQLINTAVHEYPEKRILLFRLISFLINRLQKNFANFLQNYRELKNHLLLGK